uniref:Uncharacterized protein n=1 Tax=Tanacetum cinerariifolium TaxID=118510 RepID=A0A699TYC2_TANCI|nr:hypothetical protein [Tanacetum cinerariifolium]
MKDNIDWNKVVKQVQSRQSNIVRKSQALKRNLRMSYEEIRTLFKEEYNKVQTLFKEGPEMDAERIKALRKRTRKEKVEKDEVEELKNNLEIVPDDEDNVFINVTPLSSKPLIIVDYKNYKKGKKEHF